MKLVTNEACKVPADVPDAVTERDEEIFRAITSTELSEEQVARVTTPREVFKRQKSVLAVHWHPEFVPMDLITRRIDATFPNRDEELIIPTQHNELLTYGDYAGVEVDCYASGFNQKVQLLLHFEARRVEDAHVLRSMLAHTFKYRSSQLFDFMHTITAPDEERIDRAARETGADATLVEFVRVGVQKLQDLLDRYMDDIPPSSIKNKLLRNYFDALREDYEETLINRVQAYLKAVKRIVKEQFSLKYFYRASEVIEEARSLGGGVVIPHPEQFWPILLARYGVDGYEVWNPQSQRYTEFLISVVNEKNERQRGTREPVLIFMGDDCHMGEKVKDPAHQDTAKAAREIGVQPAWDDMGISKKLIVADMDRSRVINEYKRRLQG